MAPERAVNLMMEVMATGAVQPAHCTPSQFEITLEINFRIVSVYGIEFSGKLFLMNININF